MSKKKPKYEKPTTNTQIRVAIRKLWLRSRERNKAAATMKECSKCGDTDNLEIHHKRKINWGRIFALIREEILNNELEALCKDCHDKESE